jgi:glutaconate CoA-transferase, subunit B
VDFATTSPAVDKLFTVITPLCIFRKPIGEKLLRLDCIFPYTTIEEVKENTGWVIDETKVPVMDPPAEAELAAIRQVDPNNILAFEFKQA